MEVRVLSPAQFITMRKIDRANNQTTNLLDSKNIYKRPTIDTNKQINLFLAGTGLIGSTLIRQIKNLKYPIRVCGLINSNNMYFTVNGISLQDWEVELKHCKKAIIREFIEDIIQSQLPNRVFVDCTASDGVVDNYETLLRAGIHIITSNKKANSRSLEMYNTLHDLVKENNTCFLYETNVGAGLPIINTIHNLVNSGDEIVKIEGVFSGTISYIFNSFLSSDKKFSEIVYEARESGFTEPDPRDDLNGQDVARKILILARESGFQLEPKQIKVGSILPDVCFLSDSLDTFFSELEKLNDMFDKKRKTLIDQSKKLQYIASLKNGRAQTLLQEIPQDHQFYNLSGTDNVVSISTKRYKDKPIVIKGPGAGAEVTAGGVLADVVSIFYK